MNGHLMKEGAETHDVEKTQSLKVEPDIKERLDRVDEELKIHIIMLPIIKNV